MEQDNTDHNITNQQSSQKQLNVRFVHPKLIDKTINIAMLDSLLDLRSGFAQVSFLYLYQNYHFQQKGKKLSQTEPILEVVSPDLPVDIVLHPYNQRTAKYHFIKVASIINQPDIYINIFKLQNPDPQDKKQQQSQYIYHPRLINKNLTFENIDHSLNNDLLQNQNKQSQLQLLNFICLSGFNPPPNNQRLNGDLFYIHLRTLQCADIHITASPRGFFVNQSKISSYNPQISNAYKNIFINLLDLFRTVSQKFRSSLQAFVQQRKLSQSDAIKISLLSKGITSNKWLQTCDYQHTWNSRKSLKGDSFKMQSIGIKDWNQMFQMNSQIPVPQTGTMAQMQKHKNFITIYSQFQAAAIQGSKNLVDGKIPPLNPMDDTKKHIYIFNNIFFSIANQTPFDHSQEKGQEATPSSSAINVDITNLQILQNLGISGLHVLHMAVVCYRGFKIIAQCIIPGILTGDQSNCSQYGSIDDGKTIQTNPQFQALMVQVCEKMKLKTFVNVKDGQGQLKKISGSPDIKGILGSDKRKYILDLLRLSPRDLNYEGIQNQVCILRPQLVQSFLAKKEQEKISIPLINTNIGTQIQFSPDDQTQKQKQLLKQMAAHLINIAIPQLINGLKSNLSSNLCDTQGISSAFHTHGVNLRYLGKVHDHLMLKDNIDIRITLQRVLLTKCLKHLFKIAMRDSSIMYLNTTISNLLNGIFGKKYHQQVLQEGNTTSQNNQIADLKDGKKKKKKKNKQGQKNQQQTQILNLLTSPIKVKPSQYTTMKPSQLWQIVRNLAKKRYNFDFNQNLQQYHLFKIPYQKLATLRDLCLTIGLILQKKDYNIIEENKNQNDKILPFNVKNIAGLNATVKTRNLKPKFIQNLIKTADAHFQKYSMSQALLHYNQATSYLSFLGGPTIQDLAYARSKSGKIFYVMGSHQQAINSQLYALNIYEAISNKDSAKTIQSYSTLGLYYSVKGDKNQATYYLYKSIYLMLIAFGQTYPDFLVNVVNLARIYYQNMEHAKVAEIYLKAISILKKINGKQHFKVSYFYSSLATLYYQIADFKKAIQYQTESVSILIKLLPENDNRLIDATKILKRYQEVNVNASKNYMQQMPPRPTFEINNNQNIKKQDQKKQLNKSRKGKK